MKNLLKHLQTQLQKELDTMEKAKQAGGAVEEKLEYVFEDLLAKTKQALREMENEPSVATNSSDLSDSTEEYEQSESPYDDVPDAFDGTREEFAKFAQRFKDLTGKQITDMRGLSEELFSEASKQKQKLEEFLDDIREASSSSEEEQMTLSDRFRKLANINGEKRPEDVEYTDEEKRAISGQAQYNENVSELADEVKDEHHAMRDGSKEDPETFRKNLEVMGVDFDEATDVEKLSDEELAEEALENVLENVESINDVNSDVFRSIASLAEQKQHAAQVESQTRDELIRWAVGDREFAVERNTDRLADKIQDILQEAKQSADGTIGMVSALNDHIEEIAVSVKNQAAIEPELKEKDQDE